MLVPSFNLLIGVIKNRLGIPTPIALAHEVTAVCNLRCIFCDYWRRERGDELSLNETKKVIEQARSLGVCVFCVTGGEPLLRDDLHEILRYARKNHMFTMLVTNGVLLAEKVKEIAPFLNFLTVSLDTLNADKYKYLRGFDKLDAVISGIDALVEVKSRYRRLNVNINTLLMRETLDDVRSMLNFALEKGIGITFEPVVPPLPSFSSISSPVRSQLIAHPFNVLSNAPSNALSNASRSAQSSSSESTVLQSYAQNTQSHASDFSLFGEDVRNAVEYNNASNNANNNANDTHESVSAAKGKSGLTVNAVTMKSAVNEILRFKRENPGVVWNTERYLKMIIQNGRFKCRSEVLIRLDAEGNVIAPCYDHPDSRIVGNVREESLKKLLHAATELHKKAHRCPRHDCYLLCYAEPSLAISGVLPMIDGVRQMLSRMIRR